MLQNKPINIVIADDNSFFGAALKDSLQASGLIEVKAVFTRIAELILYTSTHNFDILILDINFDGESSLDYISKIKPLDATFKIIALTSHNNDFIKENALDKGISVFVGKDSVFKDFSKIISDCFNDHKKRIKTLPSKYLIGNIKYTKQKILVLQALYKHSDKNEADIASTLCISESSLKSHKRELFEITNTSNTRELIKFGIKNGLILT